MNIDTVELKREDLPQLLFWVNRGYGACTAHDLPSENAEAWFDHRQNRLDCMVYLYYTQIGLAGLTDIADGVARLYLIVGETGYNRLRTAAYAALQMLDRAFGDLQLRRVETTVTTEDPDLRAIFPKIGFQPAGTAMRITKEDFLEHRFLF